MLGQKDICRFGIAALEDDRCRKAAQQGRHDWFGKRAKGPCLFAAIEDDDAITVGLEGFTILGKKGQADGNGDGLFLLLPGGWRRVLT